MKNISLILAFIILGLSFYPCSDGMYCDEQHETTSHNHSEDENDACSPFCICVCCGSIFVKSKIKNIKPISGHSTFVFDFYYSFQYSFSYHPFIWIPPSNHKLIS